MTTESPSSGKLRILQSESRPPGWQARVLIIDDDPAMIRTLQRVLRGHDTVAIDDAGEALRRIKMGERFGVIVCDVTMPELDGSALHAALVAEAPDQAASMLFITGGVVTHEAKDFVERQRARVLMKPFDLEELRRRVQSMLDAVAASALR
jgi:CheY-like chemotaxis protein